MKSGPLYHAIPSTTFHPARDTALVLTRDNEHLTKLDATAARVLACCHGVNTLEEHAISAWTSGAATDYMAIAAAIGELLDRGLLRESTFIGDQATVSEASCTKPITTVVVITADRPQMLRRCLQSVCQHMTTFGGKARLLVIDGSRGAQRATRQAVTEAAQSASRVVSYIGPEEAARLRRRLVSAGIPDGVLDFGLVPGAIGSNRNLAALFTAGEKILMIDDDILCEPWALEGVESEMAVGGHYDLREWAFFPNRHQSLGQAKRVSVDLLHAHAAVLGRPIWSFRELASAGVNLRHACRHMIDVLETGRNHTVHATFAGLAGDSARYCPYSVIFMKGPLRQLLRSDPEALRTALYSREVHRIVRRTTVTHDPACMSYCMGLANDRLAPPFMPIGHNEDVIFCAMLACADPKALFAHLPYGVWHDSARTAAYGPDEEMPSARQTRLSELLFMLMQQVASPRSMTPSQWLQAFASLLEDVGSISDTEFAAWVSERVLSLRCSELLAAESSLTTASESEAHLQHAFERYRKTFLRSVAAPGFFVPAEFDGCGSPAQGFTAMQAFLARFGGFIRWWPTIWEVTAARPPECPDT
jgi:hypothetical protein